MSLYALTLCCGVKIVRVIRVESWEVFPTYLRNGFEYGNQTLCVDRYYGGAGAGSQECVTLRTGAACDVEKG